MARSFLRLPISKETELRRRYDIRWRLTGIATRRNGWVVDPDGLNPLAVLNDHWPTPNPATAPHNIRGSGIERARADVVFETSSLNAATGGARHRLTSKLRRSNSAHTPSPPTKAPSSTRSPNSPRSPKKKIAASSTNPP